MKRREFIQTAIAAGFSCPTILGQDQSSSDLILWYDRPATNWNEALPLGNGRIGAMMFGGIEKETIALNEDSLWSGHPREWNNAEAKQYLPLVRKQVLQERDYVAATETCKKMQGPYTQSYMPLGNLIVRFDQREPVRNYKRSLDLDSAVATVSYETSTGRIERRCFVSFPDQVLAWTLSSSSPIQCVIELTSPLRCAVRASDSRTLILEGKAPAHVDPNYLRDSKNPIIYKDEKGYGMYFAAATRVVSTDGNVKIVDGQLVVNQLTNLTLLTSAATGFRGFNHLPDRDRDEITADCLQYLVKAERHSLEQLLERHLNDYRNLFRRVQVWLGEGSTQELPTDQRILKFNMTQDPQLAVLYFQFGRYLLISSSRPGTQPANLQGIWNDNVQPPWSSNYTVNINTQMNYWPAEPGNLPECHEPLFAMIEDLCVTGAETARVNYGCRGWVAHHNVDLWRHSAPVGNYGSGQPKWANWPMSAAWLCQHLWEHYAYSLDEAFLRNRAFPILRKACEFYLDWLVTAPDGMLTTCPSTSPENSFLTQDGREAQVTAGCTMDIALIRELFTNTITAARTLNLDDPLIPKLEEALEGLPPYKTGRYGQLLEWNEDFEEPEPGHRHVSHLYPLFPGAELLQRNDPALLQAARNSMERRLKHGSGSTSWSAAWFAALWARLREGERAYRHYCQLIGDFALPNMFSGHRPGHQSIFQIDGNFGGTAAFLEMLIQSHSGTLDFMPALPQRWANGQIQGVRCRGAVEVAFEWRDGKVNRIKLLSRKSKTVSLRFFHGEKVQKAFSGTRRISPVVTPAGAIQLEVPVGEMVEIELG